MVNPLSALIAFSVLAVVAIVLFWPSFGLFWRWRHLLNRNERVLMEDALKHLHECDYRGRRPMVQSVAGALRVSADRSAGLLRRMEAMGLLTSQWGELELTAEGRRYALHAVRVHRLWERYLSDRTGLSEMDWHFEAERREHQISPEEADELDAGLNYPTHDPHGDPIPTAEGELSSPMGQPLSSLTPGSPARVVHVEDEPDAVYAQIVAEGLHPGMQVSLIEVAPERVQFWAGGDVHVLAPVCAANVWAVPLPRDQEAEEPLDTLWALKPGERGRVLRLSRRCRGAQRQRLLDLGLVPGTVVQADMASPLGDPVAYSIRGATIALRKEQAELVQVTRENEESEDESKEARRNGG